MQPKLHSWAADDPVRQFDDLFNLVCDPTTLLVAFDRVAGNRGARTTGIDDMTVAEVYEPIGLPGAQGSRRIHVPHSRPVRFSRSRCRSA